MLQKVLICHRTFKHWEKRLLLLLDCRPTLPSEDVSVFCFPCTNFFCSFSRIQISLLWSVFCLWCVVAAADDKAFAWSMLKLNGALDSACLALALALLQYICLIDKSGWIAIESAWFLSVAVAVVFFAHQLSVWLSVWVESVHSDGCQSTYSQ